MMMMMMMMMAVHTTLQKLDTSGCSDLLGRRVFMNSAIRSSTCLQDTVLAVDQSWEKMSEVSVLCRSSRLSCHFGQGCGENNFLKISFELH